MSAKEIKELRQAGKLEEALSMAKSELEADANNIWSKRNISWVYYDYLKQNCSIEQFNTFISWLIEISNLQLPSEEKMLFETLCWPIGKMAFALSKESTSHIQNIVHLYETIKSFHFPRPTESYSFLFKALHKGLKEQEKYVEFADWWGFENFRPEDFQKEKIQDGKDIMAIAEQAYITYSKHLLPKRTQYGELIFNQEKVFIFLPRLSDIIEKHPQFQYPLYFKAKLLLAIGDTDSMLTALLPFARKKSNDFWIWDFLAEAFSDDNEKVIACYCKALSCKSPEKMLVTLRQKMAAIFISMKLYNEAKTEIEFLIEARNANDYKIPNEVLNWQSQSWYKDAKAHNTNFRFYNRHTQNAESLLFFDIPQETVIVESVNYERGILNFVASQSKFGFFSYKRFFRDIKVGDILTVRFKEGSEEGKYLLYTAIKSNDDAFKKNYLKDVEGKVTIPSGKPFGFLDDAFIHPSIIAKMKIKHGMHFKGKAIKTFNQNKKEWGWKLI